MPSTLDLTISVTLPEGTPYAGTYELCLGDCTGLDDLAVREATGFTLLGLVRKGFNDDGFGLLIATVVAWLVRRRQFSHVTFDDVARSVSWGSDFVINWENQVEDPFGEEDDEGKGPDSENDTQESSEPSPTSTE